jgi:hypothetical protein
MRKLYLFLLVLYSFAIKAQMVEGNIMFVGYNADGSDGFAIVPLVNIPANSTIYFSDNEWNGSDIGSGGAFINTTEGELTWSTGGSIISAGTVVIFNETGSSSNPGYGSSVGSIAGNINLNADNEVLYTYLGSNDVTPTIFLSAIANSGFSAGNGTLTGTGLISGTSAISITGDADVMIYNGSTVCNSTPAACAAQIAVAADWITDDGSGDQSNDANAPDFPTDLPPSFSGSGLPIVLLSFTIEQTVEKSVLIKWVTLSEINNDFFTIERSANNMDWQIVGIIEGAGNSVVKMNYNFIDFPPQSTTVYYRLKQTDYDGKYSYSPTEALNFSDNKLSIVYPNPTYGILYFDENIELNQPIRLLSSNGEDYSSSIQTHSGTSKNSIDLSRLSGGIYFLQLGATLHRIVKR